MGRAKCGSAMRFATIEKEEILCTGAIDANGIVGFLISIKSKMNVVPISRKWFECKSRG
jgi:hypothetical protein